MVGVVDGCLFFIFQRLPKLLVKQRLKQKGDPVSQPRAFEQPVQIGGVGQIIGQALGQKPHHYQQTSGESDRTQKQDADSAFKQCWHAFSPPSSPGATDLAGLIAILRFESGGRSA